MQKLPLAAGVNSCDMDSKLMAPLVACSFKDSINVAPWVASGVAALDNVTRKLTDPNIGPAKA